MSRLQDRKNQPEWQREQRINRRSTLVSFVAVALFILAAIPFFSLVKSPVEVQNEVERSMKVAPLTLTAHYYENEKELELDSASVEAGRTIAFSLSSIRPVHVSLAASVDGKAPEVLFHGAKIPPGPKRIIEKRDRRFVYALAPGVKSVRVCLITASDHDYLQKKIDGLARAWGETKDEACVVLSSAKN